MIEPFESGPDVADAADVALRAETEVTAAIDDQPVAEDSAAAAPIPESNEPDAPNAPDDADVRHGSDAGDDVPLDADGDNLFGSDDDEDDIDGAGNRAAPPAATADAGAARGALVENTKGTEDVDADTYARDSLANAGAALPANEQRLAGPVLSQHLGEDVVLVKIPNFLSFAPRPFNPDAYDGLDGDDDDDHLDDVGRARVKLGVENVVRWRRAEDGTPESNTRLVTWSDGTKSLVLGKEVVELSGQDVQRDNLFVFAQAMAANPQGMVAETRQAQQQLLKRLTMHPASKESHFHKRLAQSVADKSSQQVKSRVIATSEDPSVKRNDRIKKQQEKELAAQKRLSQQRRLADRTMQQGLTSSYLEGGLMDAHDDNGYADEKGRGKKAPAKRGARRNVSSSDDSDNDDDSDEQADAEDAGAAHGRRVTRQAPKPRGPAAAAAAAAADSAEGGASKGRGAEAPRAGVHARGTRIESDDEDHDGKSKSDDVDALGASSSGAPAKKKRRIVDEDDDE